MTKAGSKVKTTVGWDIPEPNAYNPVVFLDDGHLALANSRFDYATAEQSLASFKRFTDTQQTPLFFFGAPPKINPNDKNVYGIVDFSNQNMQGLLDAAEQDGIQCYNLANDMDEHLIDRHEAFYRTDLHWTSEAGLYATQCIAKKLNNDMNWQLSYELLDEDQFTADVFKDGFLGSQGIKVTQAVADPEDFSYLYPVYPTDVSITIPSINYDYRGDFSGFYRQETIDAIRNGNPDYSKYNPYNSCLLGGNALTRIVNHNADNDLRLLIVHDSFGRTMVQYMAMCVGQIDSVDLRRFDGSLETFIRKEGPYDAVIVLYNPGAINLSGEGAQLFDFR